MLIRTIFFGFQICALLQTSQLGDTNEPKTSLLPETSCTSCVVKKLVNVKITEHLGDRIKAPFKIEPSQMLVPGKYFIA